MPIEPELPPSMAVQVLQRFGLV
jgi:hypothetical protein